MDVIRLSETITGFLLVDLAVNNAVVCPADIANVTKAFNTDMTNLLLGTAKIHYQTRQVHFTTTSTPFHKSPITTSGII